MAFCAFWRNSGSVILVCPGQGQDRKMVLAEIETVLKNAPEVCLYGAGVVAFGAHKALQGLFGVTASSFLVTDGGGQTDGGGRIDGVPVVKFGDAPLKEGSLILVATPEEYHGSIVKTLRGRGVGQYLLLDADLEYLLMGNYLKRARNIRLIEDYSVSEGPDQAARNKGLAEDCPTTGKPDCLGGVCVYMAVSQGDRKLERTYEEKPWVRKIQVGAALTDRRVADLTDERCGRISEQNALYGELGAAYYAWKFSGADTKVTGLFHYRRILDVTDGQLGLLNKGTIDVILPLPFVCYPDASGQYGRYLCQPDIRIMLDVLGEHDRGEGKKAETSCGHHMEVLLKTSCLYNYNMVIARREVYDDYCAWMFPLLEEITDRCGKEPRKRADRYIGRIGELLTSFYFMENWRGWKVAHAKKVWRV